MNSVVSYAARWSRGWRGQPAYLCIFPCSHVLRIGASNFRRHWGGKGSHLEQRALHRCDNVKMGSRDRDPNVDKVEEDWRTFETRACRWKLGSNKWFRLDFNPIVTFLSAAIIWALVIWCILQPDTVWFEYILCNFFHQQNTNTSALFWALCCCNQSGHYLVSVWSSVFAQLEWWRRTPPQKYFRFWSYFTPVPAASLEEGMLQEHFQDNPILKSVEMTPCHVVIRTELVIPPPLWKSKQSSPVSSLERRTSLEPPELSAYSLCHAHSVSVRLCPWHRHWNLVVIRESGRTLRS